MFKNLLLFLVICCFSGKAISQSCNAGFQFVVSGLNVSFISAQAGGTTAIHTWQFGDGGSATVINPTHSYTASGVYTVTHKIIITNGPTTLCADSMQQTVTIANTNPCNLQANFVASRDSINRKRFYFTNTTLGLANTDTVRWNYGDGTAAYYGTNGDHTYANYGTYNVCIRIARPSIATGVAPCVSEICKIVVVDSAQPTVSCNATFNTTVTGLLVVCTPFLDGTPAQHFWNFGNNTTSTAVSPTVTYTTAGTYSIKHIITKYGNSNTPLCSDTVIKNVVVSQPTLCNIQPNFTYTRDSINRKKFYFNNTSVNMLATDTIRWNFGDGSAAVYGSTVNHTYTAYGSYNVCIRINRAVAPGTAPCVKELCKVVVVDSLVTVTCSANFSYTNQANSYSFTPAMGGATNILHNWSFGNGVTSTAVAPGYTYTSGGVYSVKHIVKLIGANNTIICMDSVIKTITVTVPAPCALQANFVHTRDSINKKKYYFSNTSVGFLTTDSIRWNFGDGSSSVYTTNPTYTYANYGTYNVCIRVKRNGNTSGAPCVSEICKVVVVDSNGVNTACGYTADFTMRRDSALVTKVHFTNQSTQIAGAVATWYFGDGTSATGWNAVHTYPTYSTAYQPCLRITYTNTCSKTKCKVLQLTASPTACLLQPYPNPASSVVNGNVNLTQPLVIYTRIINSQNFIVRQQQQQGFTGINTVTSNVASLPFGIYKMEIRYGNNRCIGTFIKQ